MTPLLAIAAAYAAGIVLASVVPVPVPLGAMLALAAAAAAALLARCRREAVAVPVLLVCAVAAGATSYAARMSPGAWDPCRLPKGTEVVVLGRLMRDLPGGDSARTVARVRAAQVGDRVIPLRGNIVLDVPEPRAIGAGHDVAAVGKIAALRHAREPGGFDEAAYYANRFRAFCSLRGASVVPAGTRGRLTGADLRSAVIDRTRKLSPAGREGLTADVMLSMVFGNAALDLPEDVLDRFRRAGTVHVLVVSGAQIGVLVGLAAWVCGKRSLSYPAQAALLTVLVGGYALMLPPEGTILRALTLAAVLVGARLLYRQVDVATALGVAVFAILLLAPNELFDISLQLSALAVMGVYIGHLALGPRRFPRFRRRPVAWLATWAHAIVATSVGACLATAPLIARAWGTVSLAAPVANLVAVPLASALTLLMFVSAPMGFICPPAALVANQVGAWLADAVVSVSESIGGQPWAAIDGPRWPVWAMAAAYVALAVTASSLVRKRRRVAPPSPGNDAER